MINHTALNMQKIIQKAISSNNYNAAYEALIIYARTFSTDDFVQSCKQIVNIYGPKVSVVCLDDNEKAIDEFIKKQTYKNVEIVRMSEEDTYEDLIQYMKNTDSKYISFWENDYIYDVDKISDMVWILECRQEICIAMTPRKYIDSMNTVIGHDDVAYRKTLNNVIISGTTLMEYCINNNVNLYGTLSNIMILQNTIKNIDLSIPESYVYELKRFLLLLKIVRSNKVFYMDKILLAVKQQKKCNESIIENEYKEIIKIIGYKKIETPDSNLYCKGVRKEITIFYTDKGEFYNLKPIEQEAVKRGYNVRFTSDVTEKAEIGIYCQHVCYPQNSKFSVVLLHDMAQGHNRWPNLWELERWNVFDMGIVPGKSWADRWKKCASFYYANPRCGTYEFGYPKSDYVNDTSVVERAAEIRRILNMPDRFTVLYAPSWENDNKEDEFIKAVEQLDINMLVKQSDWPEAYQHIIDNIKYMRSLHEGKYENLYYIEPEESIMTALALCDMVVSDESSVMAEALMFGKPSIAVTDWMIPDQNPPRLASVPMDYVIKCKKNDLREKVLSVMNHSEEYEGILQKGRDTFSNQGNVCRDIMDAIDYYTQGGTEKSFMSKKLEPEYRMFNMWN